jgi:hypothetical protein
MISVSKGEKEKQIDLCPNCHLLEENGDYGVKGIR